jgi:hypothetical protein
METSAPSGVFDHLRIQSVIALNAGEARASRKIN